MKITHLTLINFARIYTGMGKTKLDIELANVKEEINLFVGDNGSGKTSVLRCLHPFAYNNAIGDTTSNSKLIIDGLDGRKEITIVNEDNVYFIIHIYTRKKDGTLTVKSFIEKNGQELNDSGTSTTFKTVVETELGINETYLSLLSISDSVQGFVEYTSANRKTYASKIFNVLNIYDRYYKGISNLVKDKKALLTNIVSKMEKYKNVNLDQISNEIDDIQRNIKSLSDERTSVIQSIGGIRNQLANYQSEIVSISNIQQELADLNNTISQLIQKKSHDLSKPHIESELQIFLDEYNKLMNEINECSSNLYRLLDLKNAQTQSLAVMQSTKSNIDTGLDKVELHKIKADITNQLSNMGELPNLSINLSKDELIHANIYLDELVGICNRFAFDVNDESVIEKVHEQYKKNHSLSKNLQDKFNEVGNQIRNFSIINLSRIIQDNIPTGDCDKSECFYKKFYDDYMTIIHKSEQQSEAEINELKSKLSIIENYIKITNILSSIYQYIEINKKYFNLPRDIFNIDTFLDSYFKDRQIYNKRLLTDCIDVLEQQELKNTLMIQLDNVNNQLDMVTKSDEALSNINKSIADVELDLERIEIEITKETELLQNKKDSGQKLSDTIDNLKNELSLLNDIEMTQSKIDNVQNQLRQHDETINKIDKLKLKLEEYLNKDRQLSTSIGKLDSEWRHLIFIKADIDGLRLEELSLREEYDDLLEIKTALSPTKGLPLEFITYYVKDIMIDKINILLNSVYHGTFKLLGGDYVIIDDNNFTMPYIKGNTIVDDISHASDGERAILSIAISLVLVELSLNKYNIMLLDEIDSKLDHRARGKFIGMIETCMGIIKAEQLFVISHNNMFDSYPVNLLMTSEMTMYDNINNIKLFD